MIGFDRPTWIKWLNPRTTWFITGQFFWSYVNGTTPICAAGSSPPARCRTSRRPESGHRAGERPQHGVGQWTNGNYAGQSERTAGRRTSSAAPPTNSCQWEMLTTLAATRFYAGGTIVPFVAMAIDPFNRNFLSQLKLDYFLTNDFIIQVRENFYNDLGSGGTSLDPWGAGGLNARRDEVGLKVTYQF